jgi:hypothetical protein
MKQILFLRRCSFATEDDMTSPTRAKTMSTVPGASRPGRRNPKMKSPLTSACHEAINDDERLVHQWR